MVTGTNGKSTTCKIIAHLLKKNKFNIKLGGNIGTPVLDFKIQKNNFFIGLSYFFNTKKVLNKNND